MIATGGSAYDAGRCVPEGGLRLKVCPVTLSSQAGVSLRRPFLEQDLHTWDRCRGSLYGCPLHSWILGSAYHQTARDFPTRLEIAPTSVVSAPHPAAERSSRLFQSASRNWAGWYDMWPWLQRHGGNDARYVPSLIGFSLASGVGPL